MARANKLINDPNGERYQGSMLAAYLNFIACVIDPEHKWGLSVNERFQPVSSFTR